MTNYNKKTTDNQETLLWHVTEDDEDISSVSRRECHNETKRPWHRTTHVYLFNSAGDLLLSKRSSTKDTAPGKWTISAGGHVEYGETFKTTAEREVLEELGIKIELEMIDKLSVDYGPEREVIGIFAGKIDKVLNLNEKEVSQAKFFDFEKLVDDFLKGIFKLSPGSENSFRYIIDKGTLAKFREKILS